MRNAKESRELPSSSLDLNYRAMDLVIKANGLRRVGRFDDAKRILSLEAAPLEEEVFKGESASQLGRKAAFGVSAAQLYLHGEDFENAARVARECISITTPNMPGYYHFQAENILSDALQQNSGWS